MSTEIITTISPSTNKPVLTRNCLSDSDLALLPALSTKTFNTFRLTSLEERQVIVKRALKLIIDKQDVLARELTEQMGRPIAYAAKEITTAVTRGEYLLKISSDALKDTKGEAEKGFKRYIRKVPIGPVLILFAWNVGGYTYIQTVGFGLRGVLVSVPHLGQLFDTCSTRWQFCHHQAFTTDPYDCRACARDICRSWTAGQSDPVLSLRLFDTARGHRAITSNKIDMLYGIRGWRPASSARRIGPCGTGRA